MPFHVTIGVTGHRTLDHADILRKTVHDVIDDIVEVFSAVKRRKIKLCVLSPLAEGADRLVAEEILKYSEDATLSVVLPLIISDYIEDFCTRHSRDEFKRLLQRSQKTCSLRERAIAEEYPLEFQGEAKNQAYVNVGKYIVDHSDILIGIWDGKKSKGKGGTAHTVQYAREKGATIYVIYTQNPDRFLKEDAIS